MVTVINLADKFSKFTDRWNPRIVGDLNDMHIKVVKIPGEFVWASSRPRGRAVPGRPGPAADAAARRRSDVGPGELISVPRGVEHCPKTLTDEVEMVLIEPKGTLNTGNVTSERTVVDPARI